MHELIRFEVDYIPDDMPVEKDAKIFEAGEYPDKEITVTEADLDAIIERFEEGDASRMGVPVKVEHVDSPLDPLGAVKRVWRQGRDLFARLAFPRDLAAFLERRGIRKLSIALHKDPLRLAEVSLVLSPRVPTAAMFGRGIHKDGQDIQDGLGDEKPVSTHPADPVHPSSMVIPQSGEGVNERMSDGTSDDLTGIERDKEIAELRFALRSKDVETQLARLKAQGKIVPASEHFAREILLKGDGKVSFGDGVTTVAQLFELFLEVQPKVVVFGETAPGATPSSTLLSSDEEELLTKLGLSREQYERYAG